MTREEPAQVIISYAGTTEARVWVVDVGHVQIAIDAAGNQVPLPPYPDPNVHGLTLGEPAALVDLWPDKVIPGRWLDDGQWVELAQIEVPIPAVYR